MAKHGPSVLRNYIKKIKNEDIRDIQESIYARYSHIENLKKVKANRRENNDYNMLQQEYEINRKNVFTKKIITNSVVYLSPQFKKFTRIFKLFLTSEKSNKLGLYFNWKNY